MSNKETQVWAEVEVQGYLKSASINMFLNDEDLKEFKAMSRKEQEEYLNENGDFEVDDYRVEWRSIADIHIEENNE
tara:strand:+ start:728 stop:955 length:228 start_codon:yes stop_codon:yes gene_type:complete